MRQLFFLVLLMGISILTQAQSVPFIISAPAGDGYVKIDKNGKTIIPNGRVITPSGKVHQVAPHPYGLTLSMDGSIAITANSGTSPISISILKNILTDNPQITQIPPTVKSDKGVLESVFMGITISPDNQTVYAAGGQANKIYSFDANTGKSKGDIDCSFKNNKFNYLHGYIGDMVLSKDGRYLFAVDQIGFRILIVDVIEKKLISSCPVGRYPFGIALSKDEKTVYVANVGMYQYDYIWKKEEGEWKKTSVKKPVFAYNTPEAERGYQNDSILVPGLGPINAEESFSVWAVNVENNLQPRVIAKIKTGHLIGDLVEGIPAVGGSSPNSMVVAGKYVFISNGNNDNITVLNAENQQIVTHIKLSPEEKLATLRGIIPFGLAVSPDEKRI